MIWNPDADQPSGLVDRLVTQIETICRDDEVADIEHVARAVACFLDQDGGDAVVDPRALVLMTAQALESAGAERVARRYLLHGTGMFRPSEWEVTQGETMWVLDLKQLSVSDDAPLELIFFTGLGIVVDAIADIWDATSGAGVLGLRHVTASASALLGTGVGETTMRAMVEEVYLHCSRRLQRLQRERGWDNVPRVLDLDR